MKEEEATFQKYLEEMKEKAAYQNFSIKMEIIKKENKKFVLNILYYDESLKDKGENSDNCSFFK